MEDEERIQLNCPICHEMHEFSLAVDRSHVFFNMLSAPNHREKTIKRFKRLFTCFKTGEPFEATIKMEESFGEIIDDVKVV